jgi:hypothetical protein
VDHIKVLLSTDEEMRGEEGRFHKKVKLLTTSVSSWLITNA